MRGKGKGKIPRKIHKKIKRTTKYGEPTRKFGGKRYVSKNDWAYKSDATKQKKDLKAKGHLARLTPIKGGYRVWWKEKKRR